MKFESRAWPKLAAALLLAMAQSSAFAQSDAARFYRGKTIDIVVGFGPGGGYDLYARLLASHLGSHIPGDPNVVVENMPGAGGVRAADYVYATAPKDGTVIAGVNQGATIFELLGGQGAAYDPVQFQWLGSIAHSNNTIYTWAASGVKTLDDAKAKEVPMAGSGVISDSDIYPAVFNALVGTKFKVIDGYTGTNDSDLAVERGEVAGRGGGAYSSLVSTHPDWLRDHKINILAQIGFDKEPDLPKVPLLLDLVKTQEQREIASIVTLPTAIGYNYWVAPGAPKDRVAILTAALDATAHDPVVAAEARKMGLEIRPKTAAELRDMVAKSASSSKAILTKTKEILGW
jgi:tripartite-type tricarboxylate transporter receptor subunit TctC